jgi:hypothetical protein
MNMKECPLRFDSPPEVLPVKKPFPGGDDPGLSDEEREEEWEITRWVFAQPNHIVDGE